MEVLTERSCDLDGDGVGDNAIADLGSPAGALYAAGLNAHDYETGVHRPLVHLLCLDDVVGPTDSDFTLVTIVGEDLDEPRDPSDDFSGDERFFAVGASNLDACGEPAYVFEHAALARGSLPETEGRGFVPLLDEWLSLDRARLWGSVAPNGVAAEIDVCGYRLVGTLDHVGTSPHHLPPGLIPLEALLAGGEPSGADLPGLSPDVDLDGDGLERFVLDGDWHIAQCVDGDGTVIEGRDCFADPRMADGISFRFHMSMTSAILDGRDPGLDDHLWEECDSPPAVSLFDDSC